VSDAAQDNTSSATQPDADRPKKRVVYTTKKKKLPVTQQDTEPAQGYLSFGCYSFAYFDLRQCFYGSRQHVIRLQLGLLTVNRLTGP